MVSPSQAEAGFGVSLTGTPPRGDAEDCSQTAAIDLIRKELVLVPVRSSAGISTPVIDEEGNITADGDIDEQSLAAAIDRAMRKYIERVSANMERTLGNG